jgi:hypothetical protein
MASMGDSSHMDLVTTYRIAPATGQITSQGSVTVSARPTSLAMDPMGRFLHVGKQDPFYSFNLETYAISGASGALTLTDRALTGTGSMVGPMAVAADPQGDFVYVKDQAGQLAGYKLSAAGALTAANAVTGVLGQPILGVGLPFAFGVSGSSPTWTNGTTTGGWVAMSSTSGPTGTGSTSPGGGNGMRSLDVTNGVWGGWIVSTPAGIDYGHDWVPAPPNVSSAQFAQGTQVQLCENPPPTPVQAYDVQWSGDCSGTGRCTSVRLDADRHCRLELLVR